jgi:predicted RNA-binding protein with PIN domain
MNDINSVVRKEVKKIWPQAKKTLQQLNKDAGSFLKKTEKNLAGAYTKAKKTTDELIEKAQREKLYYELGKVVAPLLTSDQLKNKDILRLSVEIRRLSRKIRRNK